MPTNLTWAAQGGGSLGPHDSWELPNRAVWDFTDSQNTDDTDRPWSPWSRATGLSSAYNRDVTHAVAGRVQQVPSMGLLPGRLYHPLEGSFPTRRPTATSSSNQPEDDWSLDYVVITYTWGRWMLNTREKDTVITGANWMAPANSLFTRSDLDLAVQKIAGDSLVWLDVFCIPQNDDDPEKAIEIGKQGSIFRSASRAAVWLGTGGEHVLAEVCSWVPETVTMVPASIFDIPSEKWLVRTGRPKQRDQEVWRRMKIVSEFTKHVPWASSLWTLQEAALRPDAVFYGKLGEPLLHQNSGKPITIRHLRTTMKAILDEILYFLRDMESWAQRQDLWGPSDKDGWYVDNHDIDMVFQALDTVNTISVHNLGTMNASGLLLASKQRTASTAHDRVYGIMGAIGVTLTVDYRSNPDDVFDDFLLQLHNEVPAEIQSFYRSNLFQPSQRQWMVDEDARMLTLLRQKESPNPPPFVQITPEGWLVAGQIEPILARGLAHLTGRILSNRVIIAADRPAFRTLTPVEQHKNDYESASGTFVGHLCHVLRQISSKAQLALVYLGTISGIEHRGWRTAYMLLARLPPGKQHDASSMIANTPAHFQRLGVVLAMEKFSFNDIERGRFIIR